MSWIVFFNGGVDSDGSAVPALPARPSGPCCGPAPPPPPPPPEEHMQQYEAQLQEISSHAGTDLFAPYAMGTQTQGPPGRQGTAGGGAGGRRESGRVAAPRPLPRSTGSGWTASSCCATARRRATPPPAGSVIRPWCVCVCVCRDAEAQSVPAARPGSQGTV